MRASEPAGEIPSEVEGTPKDLCTLSFCYAASGSSTQMLKVSHIFIARRRSIG
jgi:hypothetical protein